MINKRIATCCIRDAFDFYCFVKLVEKNNFTFLKDLNFCADVRNSWQKCSCKINFQNISLFCFALLRFVIVFEHLLILIFYVNS